MDGRCLFFVLVLRQTHARIHCACAHLVPRDDMSRPVRAEHRIRRILGVALGLVADLRDHLLGIVARA